MKKEYEQKLKKAGAYSKFMKNSNSGCELIKKDPYKWVDLYGECISFRDFIYGAFCFNLTPEGYKYWNKIAES
jgi:hypothetical protein